MNSPTISLNTTERVLHDLGELNQNPLVGMSLCMPNQEDPSILHGNILIDSGIYKGLMIHLIFRIPPDFPLSPPTAVVAPGLGFNHKFHSHIYDEPSGNLVSKFGLFGERDEFEKPRKTEWTPNCTLSGLMLQLQEFLADPGLDAHCLPTEGEIEELRKYNRKYALEITIKDGNGTQIIKHSFEKPYPALASCNTDFEVKRVSQEAVEESKGDTTGWSKPLKKVTKDETPSSKKTVKSANLKERGEQSPSISDFITVNTKSRLLTAEEKACKLFCSVSKTTIMDTNKPILGYPIEIVRNPSGYTVLQAIPEVMSFDAFKLREQKQSTESSNLKKNASKERPQHLVWLPIYLDEAHFKRVKRFTLSAVYQLYKQSVDRRAKEFEPFMVLQILPHLITQELMEITGSSNSSATFDAVYQLLELFTKLLEVFPELQETIDFEGDDFCLDSRSTLESLVEFLVMKAPSDQGIYNSYLINRVLRHHMAKFRSEFLKINTPPKKAENNREMFKQLTLDMKKPNQRLLSQIEMIQSWSRYHLTEECRSNLGFPEEGQVKKLKEKLEWLRSNAGNDLRIITTQLEQDSRGYDETLIERYVKSTLGDLKGKSSPDVEGVDK